jgi:hypothetical protein
VCGVHRVWALADLLLNLQHIPNFEEPLRELSQKKIETGFAALEIAGVIFKNGIKFRFLKPSTNQKLMTSRCFRLGKVEYLWSARPSCSLPKSPEARWMIYLARETSLYPPGCMG